MIDRPMLWELIIRRYRALDSIRAVSKDLGVSIGVVRKVLITEGVFHSQRSDDIGTLHELGLTPEQIADELKISLSAVNNYLPYSKGTYLTAKKSINAQRIQSCRDRKKGRTSEK